MDGEGGDDCREGHEDDVRSGSTMRAHREDPGAVDMEFDKVYVLEGLDYMLEALA